MKMYTNESQTAKLIELGLPKPESIVGYDGYWGYDYAYSIGELIEMLPREYDGELLEISAVTLSYTKWMVRYPYGIIVYKNELIDALYNMIVKLKEEGVV